MAVSSSLYKRIKVDDLNTCTGCVFEHFDEDEDPYCIIDEDVPHIIGCIDDGNGYIFISIVDMLKQL